MKLDLFGADLEGSGPCDLKPGDEVLAERGYPLVFKLFIVSLNISDQLLESRSKRYLLTTFKALHAAAMNLVKIVNVNFKPANEVHEVIIPRCFAKVLLVRDKLIPVLILEVAVVHFFSFGRQTSYRLQTESSCNFRHNIVQVPF